MYKVDDKVIVKDFSGKEYIGTIINISDYREPCMKYALDIEGFIDLVFVGENQLVKKLEVE